MSIENDLREVREMVADVRGSLLNGCREEFVSQTQMAKIIGCSDVTVRNMEVEGTVMRVPWSKTPRYARQLHIDALSQSLTVAELIERLKAGSS